MTGTYTYNEVILRFVGVIKRSLSFLLPTTLTPNSSRVAVTLYMILVGLGIGASFSVSSNAAIHSFPARQRGAAGTDSGSIGGSCSLRDEQGEARAGSGDRGGTCRGGRLCGFPLTIFVRTSFSLRGKGRFFS